jgi:mannose-6-phosphate isomerase
VTTAKTTAMSDTSLYPYVLDPKLAPAIWGGGELVKQYGKHGDPSAKIGESWECWDTDTVVNGPLKGDSVATLRQSQGARFLGDLDPSRIFPVLTKIITAHDWLSVQVHPNDAYAQRVEHQANGKTECWYVFSAEPGAQLVVGWARDTSREEYERRVADGTLGEILRKIPVKAGDTVYIPSGMVHAIGSGITLFETQQASDLTYRMFDWNRVGADGKPRELHIQKAADVLNYKATTGGTLEQIPYTFESLARLALIADNHFVVERIVATSEPATMKTNGRPLIMMSLDRPMCVGCDDVEVALTRYQTALVPAGADYCTVRSEDGGDAPFMFVTPPENRDELAVQMLAAGVEQGRIDRFMEQFTSPSA